MPISFLIRILFGAVVTIGAVCVITGIITKTDIIEKIREFIKEHRYKSKSKTSNKISFVDTDANEDEDIIGVMIREVTKNKKTVKADILNRNHEVVATEIFEGDGVSEELYEGAVILI